MFGNAPQMRIAMPSITPVVKWLLIINIAVYFMQIMGGEGFLMSGFSLYPAPLPLVLQAWRLVTYQFLHGNLWHILFNMMGLFFLGPTLERHWGGKKFLGFYLTCGIAGGLLYPILFWLKIIGPYPLPLIGASGAILGMLAACAILFPHFVVFFIIFPVPIRTASVIIIFMATIIILSRGANAGGEAAHLGGMAAGAIYVFSQSWRARMKLKFTAKRTETKRIAQQKLQSEVDRILDKVHHTGIHSLNSREKKILKQATKTEQMRGKL